MTRVGRRRALALLAALPLIAAGAASGAPLRLLALGDSLVMGLGAERPEDGFVFDCYRRLLATHPDSRITSVAVVGATVADVVRSQVPRVRNERADLVVLCVGSNDVLHQTPVETFGPLYDELVKSMRERFPSARIFCCGLPDYAWIRRLNSIEHALASTYRSADEHAIAGIARTRHARYVALSSLPGEARYKPEQLLSDDGFHPSTTGYALLAQALWRAITDLKPPG